MGRVVIGAEQPSRAFMQYFQPELLGDRGDAGAHRGRDLRGETRGRVVAYGKGSVGRAVAGAAAILTHETMEFRSSRVPGKCG